MALGRQGRGRLSEIDQLPDWAEDAKLWAFGELRARKRTQLDILEEFNARLRQAALLEGITAPPVISKSAFNRTALNIAVLGRRMEETREIARVLAPKLDKAADDSVTLMVAESIKMLAHEMLSNAGALEADGATAQMLMYTSRALKHAEEAKRISAEARRKLQDEFAAKATQAVDAVADAAARSGAPIDREAVLKKIRQDIYGIVDP